MENENIYPKLVLNDQSVFNITNFNLILTSDKEVIISSLSVDDPGDVFDEMMQYKSTLIGSEGDFITSIKILDEDNQTIYADNNHTWAYSSVTVQIVSPLAHQNISNEVYIRDSGLPLISLSRINIDNDEEDE